MSVFPRVVSVEIAVEEKGSNLVGLLEVVVRDQDAVEQPEPAELFVIEAEFLLNGRHDA